VTSKVAILAYVSTVLTAARLYCAVTQPQLTRSSVRHFLRSRGEGVHLLATQVLEDGVDGRPLQHASRLDLELHMELDPANRRGDASSEQPARLSRPLLRQGDGRGSASRSSCPALFSCYSTLAERGGESTPNLQRLGEPATASRRHSDCSASNTADCTNVAVATHPHPAMKTKCES
jgi:hypothetical protein